MFKKISTLAILAAVAVALVLPACLSAQDVLKVRVKVERANIRQSGFPSAPVIAGANRGEIFPVVEKTGDWYLIQLSDGTPGFISASVVEEVIEGGVLEEETRPVERPVARERAPASAPDYVVGETAGRSDKFSMFLVRAGYFLASDSAYTDVYKNGLVFGGEFRLGIGESLAAWLEGNYRSAAGKTTYTEEETKMSVLAVEGGALYRFKAGMLSPYVGGGLGYYMFTETSESLGEAKQSQIGFCGFGGVAMVIGKSIVVDARVKYSTCSLKSDGFDNSVDGITTFDINIGGITVGIGLGMRF